MEQHHLLVVKRFCQKQLHISISCNKSIASTVYESLRALFHPLLNLLLSYINPFWLNLFYILAISALGFLALKVTSTTPPAVAADIIRPSNTADLDLFFTSVSAMTASSMSTVEMETFSNAQLVILIVLMLLGGQVFVSMLGLQLRGSAHHFPKLAPGNYLYSTNNNSLSNLDHHDDDYPAEDYSSDDTASASSSSDLDHPPSSSNLDDHPAVIGIADQVVLDHMEKPSNIDHVININHVINLEKQTHIKLLDLNSSLKYKSINSLCYIIFFYLLVTHVLGSTLVSIYITLVPTAYNILKTKHLQTQTFSVFLTVSTFANCGFIPTNRGMMDFKQNSGLLLILIPQILLGNTLYASSLRLLIWGLEKILKKEEYGYMLKNYHELEFDHLVSGFESFVLAVTAVGFIMLQALVFGIMEWGNDDGGGVLQGLTTFEKLVGFLFQGVNTRHSGESVVDLASVSPAVMMLLVVMMYLPPYTSFFPIGKREKVLAHIKKMKGAHQLKKKKSNLIQNVLFPQLIYITIFIILICITEGDKMNEDPLNFNVFSIIVEVVSAYGNVGFSTCYSCNRRLNRSEACKDTWNGFVGHWSNAGKFTLVIVMIFGRLKKFNLQGGKAWKLS